MPGAVFLEGEEINLRTIEREDLDFLSVFNKPELRQNVLADRTPRNRDTQEEFFENVICGEDSVNLMICRDGERIGIISLIERGGVERLAKMGLWIIPEHQGKGYGTEASELVTEYGFKQLNYHRIFYRAHEDNSSSQRLAEKLGFEKEAVLEDHTFKDGEYKDIIYYRMLEEEWDPNNG